MFRRAVRYSQKALSLPGKLKDIKDKRLKPLSGATEIAIAIFSIQLANLGSLNNFSQSISYPSVSTIARSADTMDLKAIRETNCYIYKKGKG